MKILIVKLIQLVSFSRIIKMSSPKLNNIIILGCILCYASVVLFGLDARFLDLKEYGNNCNVRYSSAICYSKISGDCCQAKNKSNYFDQSCTNAAYNPIDQSLDKNVQTMFESESPRPSRSFVSSH